MDFQVIVFSSGVSDPRSEPFIGTRVAVDLRAQAHMRSPK